MDELLDSRLKALKNALLFSTEGIKEVQIDSQPDDLRAEEVTYRHVVLVSVIPSLPEDLKRKITYCFQKQIRTSPIGEVELRIDDHFQPLHSQD